MNNGQRLMTAARVVTVASVAGSALAVGVAAYQPQVAHDPVVRIALQVSPHHDSSLHAERTTRESR